MIRFWSAQKSVYEFQSDYANCKYSISSLGEKSPLAPFQCTPAALHLCCQSNLLLFLAVSVSMQKSQQGNERKESGHRAVKRIRCTCFVCCFFEEAGARVVNHLTTECQKKKKNVKVHCRGTTPMDVAYHSTPFTFYLNGTILHYFYFGGT